MFQLAQSIHQGYESVSMISCDDATPAEIVAALRQLGAGGLLTASLRTVGRSIGVLQLALLHQERPPGVVEAALVRALAAQIAVAIENAQVLTRTRADQERTSAVVDATNDAILMLDEHRRVMVINRRARFFFGLSEHELIGKDYDQFSAIFGRIFEEGRQFNNWLRQLLRSDRERAVEEFHTTGSDSRLLQCFSAPVVDRHDHLLGRLLVFRDVTREREVERLKSEFVSTVSHELRTPLSSIQGALQLVLGNPHLQRPGLADNLPPRAHSLLTISLNNTARLIRLINDILDVAKIEQGRVTLQRDAVEAERLCRSACDEVAALSGEREITIDVRVAPNLPPVFADYDRAVQVLVNLLSNAIKFSANSQRVEVRASRDGNYVCFAVQDWGRGIAQLDQARLFQKFQQVDSSSTRETGGTGLGLAISRALVEEHGGRIWLESEEQQGSTFSFSLPIANDPATHSASGQHVLLCVPDGALQETLAAGFQQAGINVVSVDPAHIALRLQNAQPDLLLAGDIPGDPTRLEFLRKLRNETRNHGVPLVLISDRIETSADIKVLPQASTAQLIEETIHKALEVYRPLVLVVDDDPNVRPVIARLLLRHGMRVRQAADGYEGLEIAARLRPDVILLDVMMPGIDGYEVLRRLRADPSTADVAVIILSANDLSDQSPQAVPELRIADHLEKPISAERLTNSISRVIAGSRNA
ncbi:MAG: response regulator [Oscillochloris sp.]|nr:response regulator [Oscillochloris sp.]